MSDRLQRRVVCSAIRKGDTLICGPRHFDQIMREQIDQMHYHNRLMAYAHDAEQGFIDQWGKFMNREEAFEVATAAGQIRQKTGNPDSKELFSEDLY